MGTRKRLTIGFLVSGITDHYTEYLCRGVLGAAEDLDVNLVIIPGKYINRNVDDEPELMYEYQNNTIFSYVQKGSLDALVIAADCIGIFTTKMNIIRFLAEYKGIPCVLASSTIPGYSSVVYDNKQGIVDGLTYLIKELGCRQIGMIGAPDDNSDAKARKEAFMETIQKEGLSFEERFFVEGNLAREGNDGPAKMLDQNPDVEAVFCANDDTALALYDEMEMRGMVPGRDIKIFGYDDTLYAAKATPSLSSVSADPVELGRRSLELVVSQVMDADKNGVEEAIEEVLETKLIIRNSLRDISKDAIKASSRLLNPDNIDEYFDSIFYRYKKEDRGRGITTLHIIFQDMMENLLAMCSEGQISAEREEEVNELFEGFLDQNALQYADIDILLQYFEQLKNALKREGNDKDLRYGFGKLFARFYRKIIYAMAAQSSVVEDEIIASRRSMRSFVHNMLQFDRGTDQSYAALLSDLDWLGVANAYIYTFDEPVIHLYKEKYYPPEVLYLKAILRNGKVKSVPSTKQEIDTVDMFRHRQMQKGRYSMVAMPLYFNEMLYGIILCDMTEALFENGDFFADHLSSAMKMIATLRSNENIQEQLEEHLVTMKEHNVHLDKLSKSDMLTGILNRRGFMDTAAEQVMKNQAEGVHTLVAYIDMNNLKIINDRYGHEEGDFSLKLIGELLIQNLGESAIVGRIGGDEFTCLVPVDEVSKETETEFVNRITQSFTEYNFVSSKPYNITVSTGAHIVKAGADLSLDEALALADQKLYVAKQSRVKSVAKKEIW